MSINLLSNLIITDVRSVSTMHSLKTSGQKRNNRPRWAVIVKYEGETVYESKGKRFLSDLNHVAVLPKGCSYTWECTKPGHYIAMEFESALTYGEPIFFSVKHGEKILKLLKDLEYRSGLHQPMQKIERIRDAYSVLLLLASSEADHYVPSEKQKKLQPAIEYISLHCNEPIKNQHLASLLGLSEVYFRKLFTQVMGVSPIVYARQRRIEKAKELLRGDYSSLTEIARTLGYTSLYDFSRDFKKHCGVSPSKYRAT
jgi:AraC-like DNA-binding protein